MKEIILPIKCSTVKKAHDRLERITGWLGLATIFAWGLWGLSYNYWIITAHTREVDFDGFVLVLFSWIGIVVACGIVVIVGSEKIPKIWNSLPSLGCIKDDDTKEP